MEKNIAWLGDGESERNWDEVFALFYKKGRGEIFPGELKFWRKLCEGRENVLEIGAGSGFIAGALADAGIGTLTLVEPEPANVRFLEGVAAGARETRIAVAPVVFQNYTPPPGVLQDVIYMSWDNLVMFRGRDTRAALFLKAAENLKPGGAFAFHISSRKWNRGVYEKLRVPKIFDMELDQYGAAKIEYQIDLVSGDLYNKHIVIALPSGERKSYLLPTEAIAMEEVLGHAAKTGLELSEHYSDYSGTPVGENADDHVLVFRKR